MNEAQRQAYGDELYAALRARAPVAPLSERVPDLTIEDAYFIARRMVQRRCDDDGERIVGKKIGVSSKPVQQMLNVHQPDFGWLTDAMWFPDGATLPASTELIQPRAEAEIAFFLKRDLSGPGVTNADVLAATEAVAPCFEVVDSRIADWKIKIGDTIADNASCGVFVVGEARVDPRDVDLCTAGCVVYKNGEVLSTGAGAAALGSPLNSIAWLANTLGAFDISLRAGEVVLSGSLVPLEPVGPGDEMEARIAGLGKTTVRFA